MLFRILQKFILSHFRNVHNCVPYFWISLRCAFFLMQWRQTFKSLLKLGDKTNSIYITSLSARKKIKSSLCIYELCAVRYHTKSRNGSHMWLFFSRLIFSTYMKKIFLVILRASTHFSQKNNVRKMMPLIYFRVLKLFIF